MATPQAYRVVISPEASENLQAIYDYIAVDSKSNASRMVNRLLRAIESLNTFPHRTLVSQRRRSLKHPVRKLPLRPYIIYFRIIEEEKIVRILTIRHGARRQPRRF